VAGVSWWQGCADESTDAPPRRGDTGGSGHEMLSPAVLRLCDDSSGNQRQKPATREPRPASCVETPTLGLGEIRRKRGHRPRPGGSMDTPLTHSLTGSVGPTRRPASAPPGLPACRFPARGLPAPRFPARGLPDSVSHSAHRRRSGIPVRLAYRPPVAFPTRNSCLETMCISCNRISLQSAAGSA
jgi:hypothetical protein